MQRQILCKEYFYYLFFYFIIKNNNLNFYQTLPGKRTRFSFGLYTGNAMCIHTVDSKSLGPPRYFLKEQFP